ncbi:LysR family transcriptional regulator [Aurantimonas sp. VKM B-3413]|uniref:LysR family transcriptional regulator n=1 Tax=Aurantimonas sp. VKM B-3413 TaxID=2779401 RepID=UPI001E3CC73F|nr:LysR family transcriptional regulator [Aurantimonas sp. VKM B-3413]MCB8838151.1 LysR family transcriptional regulator [Aurantimonas sp. VKM B-3413]
MTLEQLRIFLEVAELQHVTRAAERLNLTQSAVSASIAALEARHQVKLFDRVGRRIELTEAGRLFVPEARATLGRAEAAELVLADLSGQTIGEVRIHASQTVASYWLPPRLVRLHGLYPRIDISLTVGNTAQVARAVSEGSADLGVVEGAVHLAELEKWVVGRDRLVLVVGKDHPWARRESVPPADYAGSDWVLREIGSGTRAEFEDLLAGLGIAMADLPVLLEFPSNEAVLAAVEAGSIATVLSDRAAVPALSAGRVVTVGPAVRDREFVALRNRGRYHTRAATALLDLLRESAADSV